MYYLSVTAILGIQSKEFPSISLEDIQKCICVGMCVCVHDHWKMGASKKKHRLNLANIISSLVMFETHSPRLKNAQKGAQDDFASASLFLSPHKTLSEFQ